MTTNVQKQMEKLSKLHRRRNELWQEIERSMAIQTLWPDAFKAGRCVSYPTGSLHKADEMLFVIERQDGVRYNVVLERLPRIIFERMLSSIKDADPRLTQPVMLWWEMKRRGA